MRPVGCAELEDLIHLPGPLTEDAVLKCLHARFSASQLYVSPAYYMLLLYITCAIYIKLWRPLIGGEPLRPREKISLFVTDPGYVPNSVV